MKITKNEPKREMVRPLAPKESHSKICTSKGSRDRRIRLSANTAIRFYDVQDRLGFGRSSNAIDWLMKEAKAAIDVLNAGHHQYFNISEAFHRASGGSIHQNLNQHQIDGYNRSQFEIVDSRNRCQSQNVNSIPVVQDTDFHSSTIRRNFDWNPNYNESEGFEFVTINPVGDHLKNESYDLLGVSFEEDIQDQQAVRITYSIIVRML
ncbi:hypothetical protein R6Q59_028117, partial [Mikania micrantha]